MRVPFLKIVFFHPTDRAASLAKFSSFARRHPWHTRMFTQPCPLPCPRGSSLLFQVQHSSHPRTLSALFTIKSKLQGVLYPEDPRNFTGLPYKPSAAAVWLWWLWFSSSIIAEGCFSSVQLVMSWLIRVANPFHLGVKKRPVLSGLAWWGKEEGKQFAECGCCLGKWNNSQI